MEPLSALSLFCNITDICNHSIKVCKECREIYRSTKGRRDHDEQLLKYLGDLQQTLISMRASSSRLNRDDLCKSVVGPLNRMEAKSVAFKDILDGFRARNPGNRFASVMATAKVIRGQGQLDRAVQELKQCQNDVHFAIAQSTRVQIQEISTQADRLSKGQREIQSILTNLDARLKGLEENFSEVPDIVAKAKDISGEVRTELCALSILGRLGGTNQRYSDVPKVDPHTFHWILRDEDERSHTTHDVEQESDREGKQTECPWEVERRVRYEHTQRHVNARLTEWLRQGSGLFHIAGKPGSGKSTLMKYLVQHPKVTRSLEEWAKPKRLALGKFFLWKLGHGQNSLDALIRGLLYSLIHFDAELVHSAFPSCSTNSFEQLSLQSRLGVTKEETFEAFNTLAGNSAVSKRFNFCFFIDGLDELDEEKDTTHAQIVKLLQQWTDTAKGFVKICVSSRPFPVFEDMPVDYRIQLQDLTRYDILSFVHHTLLSDGAFRSEMTRNSEDCLRLIRAISDGSDGVFLWVSLVVKSVERGLSNADSVTVLLQRVKRTPRKLEALFESLLDNIEDCHAQTALLLLAVSMEFVIGPKNFYISVPGCRQFFRAMEGLASRNGNTCSIFHPQNTPEAFDWTREEAKRTKSQLAFRCKGLLEIVTVPGGKTCEGYVGGHVAFIHRSIPEFLERRILKHIGAHGLYHVHVQNAMCWMLWAEIEFENSRTNLKHLSTAYQETQRAYIRSMVHATMGSRLWTVGSLGPDLWTTFQLLDRSEDALLPTMFLSAEHGRNNDASIEGITWNTFRIEGSDDSTLGSMCSFFPLPVVAAAVFSEHAYLHWCLPRMRQGSALCGATIVQHCLEAAFEQILCLVQPIRRCVADWMHAVNILIHGAGADVNGTLLPCCRIELPSFEEAGALPSVFDAFWITALFHNLYEIEAFRPDFFCMVEFLLKSGARPRSVLCIGAARECFRISSPPSEGLDTSRLSDIENRLDTRYMGFTRNEVAEEYLRMVCGKKDGIITLEKLVAYAKPPNMLTILQLIGRNSSADAKLGDVSGLSSTERLRAAMLEKHGIHRDGKLIWIKEYSRDSGLQHLRLRWKQHVVPGGISRQ